MSSAFEPNNRGGRYHHGGSDTDSLSTSWKPPVDDPFASSGGGQPYGRTRDVRGKRDPPVLPRVSLSDDGHDDDDDMPFDQLQAALEEAGPSFDENEGQRQRPAETNLLEESFDTAAAALASRNHRGYRHYDDTEEKKVPDYGRSVRRSPNKDDSSFDKSALPVRKVPATQDHSSYYAFDEPAPPPSKLPKSILKKGGRSSISEGEDDDGDHKQESKTPRQKQPHVVAAVNTEDDSLMQSSPEQQDKKKHNPQQPQPNQVAVSSKKKTTVRKSALKKGTLTKTKQQRRADSSRSPRTTPQLDDSELDDDTSLDVPYGSAPVAHQGSLRKRSEQAWNKRNNAAASKRKGNTSRSSTPTNLPKKNVHTQKIPVKKDVSFGVKNSVYEFQPDQEEEEEEESEEDNQTVMTGLTGVSLNSTYTKSMDSEVEDMVKDLLFIGNGSATNPGRRKIKQNPAVKRKLAAKQEEKKMQQHTQEYGNSTYHQDRDGEYMDESTVGDSTLDTYGDATLNTLDFTVDSNMNRAVNGGTTITSRGRTSPSEGKPEQDDPVAALWGLVEGGVNAVGGLLGYADGGKDTKTETPTPLETQEDSTTRKSSTPQGATTTSPSQGQPPKSTKARFTKQQPQQQPQPQQEDDDSLDDTKSLGSRAFNDSPPADSLLEEDITPTSSQETDTTGSTMRTVSPTGGFAEFMNFATSFLVGNEEVSGRDSTEKDGTQTLKKQDTMESVLSSNYSKEEGGIENDPEVVSVGGVTQSSHSTGLEQEERLLGLAVYAARAKHEVYGYELKETDNLDITTQVKFNVIRVSLPMGILFQENGGGCWVTKVFPTGNAALHARGGNVEAGDQLAAINGVSAVEMKVDKICSLVGNIPEDQEIELTFLRYIGPLQGDDSGTRHTTKKDQGIEVEDLTVTSAPTRTRSWKNVMKLKKNRSVTTTTKGSNNSLVGSLNDEGSSMLKMTEATDTSSGLTTPQDGPTKEKKKFKLFGRGKKK